MAEPKDASAPHPPALGDGVAIDGRGSREVVTDAEFERLFQFRGPVGDALWNRCTTCGMETTGGPMSQHLRASGHDGQTLLDELR